MTPAVPLPWKDVLAMILAGIQVILTPLMIFAAVAAGVLFLVLALLR
jgi:hypothetical protein